MDAATASGGLGAGKNKQCKSAGARRRNFPKKTSELSKEELLLTLKKKRECTAKALKIVESLLEPQENDEVFVERLQHINQSHYQDAIEERAISKLCGYPICTNLLKQMPTQQYCISTKLNKVYDITERKLFCSNLCFHASRYIKDQMLTSPLWLRDIEQTVELKLMPSSELRCSAGDEIHVGVGRVSKTELVEMGIHDENKKSPTLSLNKKGHGMSSEGVEAVATPLSDLDMVYSIPQEQAIMENFSCNQRTVPQVEEGQEAFECKKVEEVGTHTDGSGEILLRTDSEVQDNQGTVKSTLIDCSSIAPYESDTSSFVVGEQFMLATDSIEMGYESKVSQPSLIHSVLWSGSLAGVGAIQTVAMKSEPSLDSDCPLNFLKEANVPVLTPDPLEEEEKYCALPDICEKNIKGDVFHTPFNFSEARNKTASANETIEPSVSLSDESSESFNNNVAVNDNLLNDNQKTFLKNKRQKKKRRDTSSDVFPLVSNVEKCIQEWITMESICFLFGQCALQEMLQEKGESMMKNYKALDSATWDPEKHERFLAICKRLSLLEIEDSSFDNQVKKVDTETLRKPLPDYNALKKESEIMELKVQAFLKGKLEVAEKKVTFSEGSKVSSVEDQDDTKRPLEVPLVHLHSQRALRKKIVLDGFNRVLPDFLRTFGIRSSEVISSLRGLVSTFSFTPSNITFKPQEWSLVSLIIIKLLSLREPRLKFILDTEQSRTYLTLILMSYKLESGYLDRLLIWLTDIDLLLSKTNSKCSE